MNALEIPTLDTGKHTDILRKWLLLVYGIYVCYIYPPLTCFNIYGKATLIRWLSCEINRYRAWPCSCLQPIQGISFKQVLLDLSQTVLSQVNQIPYRLLTLVVWFGIGDRDSCWISHAIGMSDYIDSTPLYILHTIKPNPSLQHSLPIL